MKKLFLLIVLACSAFSAQAQDDFGLWTSVEGSHKFSKKLSADIEVEHRLQDNASRSSRWTFGASAAYKFGKHLKASAGYKFIHNYTPAETTYEEVMKANGFDYDHLEQKTTEAFWRNRHRIHFALQGDVDLGRFNIALREKYQFTHKLSATALREKFTYEFDDLDSQGRPMWYWDDPEADPRNPYEKTFKAKTKHTLDSRLKAEYNIRQCPVDPFAEVELRNRIDDGFSVDQIDYCIGAEWKINKQHSLSLAYHYKDVQKDNADDDVNTHVVAIGYKVKF